MLPRRSYLICTTNRTGSWLLCHALQDTGLAGIPAEYFWRGDMPFWAARWSVRPDDFEAYLGAALTRERSENGVFGSKMMRGYFDDFIERARTIPRLRDLEPSRLLDDAFPGLRYLWLSRRDTLRQAISFVRATRTGVWGVGAGAPRRAVDEPGYDFHEVDAHRRLLESQDAAWGDFFDAAGVRAFRFFYEDLVDRREDVVRSVLDAIGVRPAHGPAIASPRTVVQADELTEQWVRRYEDDDRTTSRTPEP